MSFPSSCFKSSAQEVEAEEIDRSEEKRGENQRVGSLIGSLASPSSTKTVEAPMQPMSPRQRLMFSSNQDSKVLSTKLMEIGASLHCFSLSGEAAPLASVPIGGVVTWVEGRRRPFPLTLRPEQCLLADGHSFRKADPKGVVVYAQVPTISHYSDPMDKRLIIFKAESPEGGPLSEKDFFRFFNSVVKPSGSPTPRSTHQETSPSNLSSLGSSLRHILIPGHREKVEEEHWPAQISVFVPCTCSILDRFAPSMVGVQDFISHLQTNPRDVAGERREERAYKRMSTEQDAAGNRLVTYFLKK